MYSIIFNVVILKQVPRPFMDSVVKVNVDSVVKVLLFHTVQSLVHTCR